MASTPALDPTDSNDNAAQDVEPTTTTANTTTASTAPETNVMETATSADDTKDANANTAAAAAATEDNNNNNNNNNTASTPALSKNQRKRQLKWEQAMAVKKRRKEQEKEIQLAKAKAQGRDIEAEKKRMEAFRLEGVGRAKREEKWKEKLQEYGTKWEVCIDCSFDNLMTEREQTSLGSQIRFCYANNKKAKYPLRQITLTSVPPSIQSYLERVSGFEQWANRCFRTTSQDILQTFPNKSSLVYLSSDAETELTVLEPDKVYIIGGIVDRNRCKRLAIDRAQEMGIATAKLPINQYLHLVGTKVLTVNHVFEILLRLKEFNNDWKETMLNVLPARKQAK
eukprot:Nitzschia sp. Nitz4//scaffold254_size28068//19928//20947//NITZ4_008155-RA/size28068-processed-gene-0.9-mRNA-1//-1//CDS//3329544343//5474//frame0